MRVLVVEDHKETRSMIEAILREAGYAAVPAGTLAEARGVLEAGGLGADDYLKKPFAAAELLAHVRALLRRGPRLVEPLIARAPVRDSLGSDR